MFILHIIMQLCFLCILTTAGYKKTLPEYKSKWGEKYGERHWTTRDQCRRKPLQLLCSHSQVWISITFLELKVVLACTASKQTHDISSKGKLKSMCKIQVAQFMVMVWGLYNSLLIRGGRLNDIKDTWEHEELKAEDRFNIILTYSRFTDSVMIL